MQMEDYLYQKDLFLPLGGVAKKPMTMKDEEWEILDRKALGTIQLSLAASVAFNISKENTMNDLMDTLDKLYEKPSASNKVFLMKILFNMKLSEGGSIAEGGYEIACWFSLIVLGRCCRYVCLLNKQRTFKLFGW
jgi:hypothetical protein